MIALAFALAATAAAQCTVVCGNDTHGQGYTRLENQDCAGLPAGSTYFLGGPRNDHVFKGSPPPGMLVSCPDPDGKGLPVQRVKPKSPSRR